MPAAALSSSRPPPDVLALLTAEEARDFLPEALLGEVRRLAGRFEVQDPTGLGPEAVHTLLESWQPEVILAAWQTPPLPVAPPPSLRYVCYLCGSVRKLVSPAHLEAGLLVTNWGGSISRIVAEWALFHVLSCLRRATHWTLAMHNEGAWKTRSTETASLFGRRVGLHGFGRIARELLRLLQPFEVEVSVCAPDVTPEMERTHRIRAVETLDALFSENDIIVELAPLNPSTAGMVREEHLRRIRPGGVFVNVGRGAVVDEAALLRVAREGNIFIGLDVYGVEPLPPTSPFRGLRNVCLTPHIAGPTTDRRRDAGAFAVANLAAYAAGRAPEAIITPEIYACST